MARYRRSLPLLLIALIVMAVAYAFAATNTVPVTNAGDGKEDISGYTVSDVHYVLNGTDPSRIEDVTFTLTPDSSGSAAASVQIQLVSGGAWFSCTVSGSSYSCDINGAVTALDADNLRVVAAQ